MRMPQTALPAAQEQLRYWQRAHALAVEEEDDQRIARCEHFIEQIESIISALQRAAEHVSQDK